MSQEQKEKIEAEKAKLNKVRTAIKAGRLGNYTNKRIIGPKIIGPGPVGLYTSYVHPG